MSLTRWVAHAVLLTAIIPVHGQEQSSKTKKTKDASENLEAPVTQTPSVVITGNQIVTGYESDGSKEQPKSYLGRLLSAEILPTVALVIVGFFPLWAIWNQGKDTRKAADAALLNAQALFASERPWFVY